MAWNRRRKSSATQKLLQFICNNVYLSAYVECINFVKEGVLTSPVLSFECICIRISYMHRQEHTSPTCFGFPVEGPPTQSGFTTKLDDYVSWLRQDRTWDLTTLDDHVSWLRQERRIRGGRDRESNKETDAMLGIHVQSTGHGSRTRDRLQSLVSRTKTDHI